MFRHLRGVRSKGSRVIHRMTGERFATTNTPYGIYTACGRTLVSNPDQTTADVTCKRCLAR
jgi:hypothetical protein